MSSAPIPLSEKAKAGLWILQMWQLHVHMKGSVCVT